MSDESSTDPILAAAFSFGRCLLNATIMSFILQPSSGVSSSTKELLKSAWAQKLQQGTSTGSSGVNQD